MEGDRRRLLNRPFLRPADQDIPLFRMAVRGQGAVKCRLCLCFGRLPGTKSSYNRGFCAAAVMALCAVLLLWDCDWHARCLDRLLCAPLGSWACSRGTSTTTTTRAWCGITMTCRRSDSDTTTNYPDMLKAPVSLWPGLQQLLTAPAQSPPAEGAGHSPASESPTIEKVISDKLIIRSTSAT